MLVEEINVNGKLYQRLRVPEYATTVEPGKPELPAISKFVMIPWDKNPSLKVVEAKFATLRGKWNIYPYQLRFDAPEEGDQFQIDVAFYSQNRLYPDVVAGISPPGIWRDVRIVHLTVYPIRYNPAVKQLDFCRRVVVQVDFLPGPLSADVREALRRKAIVTPEREEIYRGIINYDRRYLIPGAVVGWSDPICQIIVPDELYDRDDPNNPINRLANYWRGQGYTIWIATLSQVGGSSPGQIRSFIRSRYFNYGIEYVLLAADSNYIPPYTTSGESPGDHYYAALGSIPDYYRDVKIGRLSAHDLDELTVLVNKTLDYIQDSESGDWPKRSLLVASDDDPVYEEGKENIRNDQWYYQPIFDTAYGSDGATNNNIINAINNGRGVVNYRGHGGPEAWDTWSGNISFTTDNVDSLTNENKYCAIFSICCRTGEFDWDWDCLAEAFCKKSNGGAVGVVAAFGKTNPLPNNYFDEWLYVYTYGAPHCNIGSALDAAIFWTLEEYMGDIYKSPTRYTWFGDPLLDLHVTPIYKAPSLAGLDLNSKKSAELKKTMLLQNFPNKANPETWIPYVLAKPTEVTIVIYDTAGKLIRKLELGYKSAGVYVTRDRPRIGMVEMREERKSLVVYTSTL